jgi:glutaredoxin
MTQTPDTSFLAGHSFVVYSEHHCPDCRRLDLWLEKRGVTMDKIDIAENPSAAEKLENETGKMAVPFILVNGRTWVRGYHKEVLGRFDERTLLRELAEAVDGGTPKL